jgi:hypothetical protein
MNPVETFSVAIAVAIVIVRILLLYPFESQTDDTNNA